MLEPTCKCAICQHHHDFSIPDGLVDDIMAGRVAIFAGAGISTENKNVLSDSLYEIIAHKLNKPRHDLPFPDLMSEFGKIRDGRLKLIQEIRDRFSYIRSYPEVYRNATRFHRELATFFP